VNTEACVRWLLAHHRLSHEGLDCTQFHGITWERIERRIQELYPTLTGEDLVTPLQERFHRMFVEDPPPFIPGAAEALARACGSLPTAIVTSSNRESVDCLLERVSVGQSLRLILSAEDYTRSKPDPECYCLAAKRLAVEARRCLVFEDSIPGLQAARNARMHGVAIVHRARDPEERRRLADLAVADYTALPPDFFQSIQAPGAQKEPTPHDR